MKKLLKILAFVIGALFVLIIAAVVIIPLVFDPNDYKDVAIKLAKEHTGRELRIPGKIELSIFPWIGVHLGETELGNAPGFGKKAFARIKGVDVRVEFMPLLKGEYKVGKVALHGLQLNLSRKASGQTNWDDLVGKPAPSEKKPPSKSRPKKESAPPAAALAALAIQGIEIRDAEVVWDDKLGKQYYQLKNFNLELGALALKRPIPLETSMDFVSKNPAVTGHIELSTQLTLDLDQQRYTLSKLKVTKTINGSIVPTGKLTTKLTADSIHADLAKQTLDIKHLQLEALGLTVKADIQGTQIIKAPTFKGNLAVDDFVPREIMKTLGIQLPPMADAAVLTKANLSTQFNANLNSAALTNLKLNFDNSHITGKASIKNFAKPAIRYDLALDAIDVDRYLPPPSKKKTAVGTPASAAAAGAMQLPTEQLRALDINGTFKIGKLKASNLHSSDIHMTLVAKKGRIRLHPLGAKLYSGVYKGDLGFDVSGKTPRISMNESLQGVQIGPLLKDFMGDDKVRGTASLKANLTANGIDPMAVRKTLNGTVSFTFKDGAVKGINIRHIEQKLKAKLKGKTPPKEDAAVETDFAKLSGSAKITNGLVTNKDLTALAPHARVKGKGTAHLVSEKINYDVEVKFTSAAEGQGGKTFEDMNKVVLPVHIGGTFSKPTIDVDYKSVLKTLAKQELKKKERALKQKAKKKIAAEKQQLKEKRKQAEKKLKKKLDDKLKKLFKF